MDWLTFFSTVVASLSWPATVLVVLILIRKELPEISSSLRRIKYKDIEFEFSEVAKAVENEVKEAIPGAKDNAQLSGHPLVIEQRRLESIGDISPRAAILEAWLQVEAAAVKLIQKRRPEAYKSYPGPMRLRDNLVDGQILNLRQLTAFENLRKLRNEAVHVPDIEFTKSAVSSYVASAIVMATYLEELASVS
jgi:hypothetical protein